MPQDLTESPSHFHPAWNLPTRHFLTAAFDSHLSSIHLGSHFPQDASPSVTPEGLLGNGHRSQHGNRQMGSLCSEGPDILEELRSWKI